MAEVQKMQDDPMDGGGRISSGMTSRDFLSVHSEHKKTRKICGFFYAYNLSNEEP